jgi:hypothetical protein
VPPVTRTPRGECESKLRMDGVAQANQVGLKMPHIAAGTRTSTIKRETTHLPPGHTHPEHSRPGEASLLYYTTKTNRLSRVGRKF